MEQADLQHGGRGARGADQVEAAIARAAEHNLRIHSVLDHALLLKAS